ncbi:MAG: M23 family metallopeptidase [Sphingomonadales bacterium]|nr:M23 family metallopeptidase [Sphingomonadales bacterium]
MAGAATPSLGVVTEQRASLPGWRRRIEHRFHKLDLFHDLAEDIGSLHWYRGFATMLALGFAALAFWPDFSAVEAATTVRADAAVRDEYRSQTIAPLAFGGDSGRRMAPGAVVRPLASLPERTSLQLVATLGEGDSFGRMLQRAGVGAYDAARTSDMVAAVMPLGEVRPGTRFDLTLGRRMAPGGPRSLDKLIFRARFDLDLAVERQGESLTIARHPVAVDATPLRIRGTVGASLFRAARAAGAPMRAVEQYLQTIAAHLSLDGDVAPTDQFDMIVAYKRAAGGENEVGDLVYAGLERDGKPIAQLVRWKDGQFVDAANFGEAGNQPQVMGGVGLGGMIQPVNGHITSLYGLRRHPILGYVRMHSGVDFGAAWGSPIVAVSDGIVAFAGRHGGHGNYVRLEHGGGLGTGYGHMSRIAVSPGTKVHAGEVIGYVGSSGLSTGPHLHYEVYENGRTVNPLGVHFTFRTAAVGAAVDKGELAAVKSKIAQLKGAAPGAALQKFAPKYAPVKGASIKGAPAAKYESD